ncbi:hypothetical protein K431DRAFT_282605 [Polychaeton citri CBS 116435]|uniref:Monooxygenase n=1 Tax=Polychaeton citri CBS 116435 TaxID=1314669 RepID=A0A9P4QDJ9_9PEZI|nr:hypothetical protein K431DRAFT_282605 [Polychaeton citri CBS 116435]
MSAKADFTPLLPPSTRRPKASFFGRHGPYNLLRDQLTITSWMALGAMAQGVLFLIFGRLALIPAVGIVLFRTLDAYAQATGWKHNTYMDGVITQKMSAQFPDERGQYGSTAAKDQIVVFLIGSRCNHPLGALAPGFRKLGNYFVSMTRDLERNAEEFGFLGMTSWVNNNGRAAKNELLEVGYFKNYEGLHKFAHSKFHREGWSWYNRVAKEHPHFSIYHETYVVPAGHWESIYANSHPSGIMSTVTKFKDPATGEDKWASPVVDASKGPLKTSKGRMDRSLGQEHDSYEKSPFIEV